MDSLISVIIATRNRDALLAQTLEALAGQDWPRSRFEILVADNGSTDGTRGVVDRAAAQPTAPRTRYLYVAAPGKSPAVNTALLFARGKLSPPIPAHHLLWPLQLCDFSRAIQVPILLVCFLRVQQKVFPSVSFQATVLLQGAIGRS